MDANPYPLKAARMRAKVSLLTVAAAAGTTLNTAGKYEVARDSVREDLRTALDAVYGRFPQVAAKVA